MVETCALVTYNINNINKGQGQCNLKKKATNSIPYQYEKTTDMCVMTRGNLQGVLTSQVTSPSSNILDTSDAETTSNPVTMVTTNVFSNSSFIIGTVETVQNLCTPYSYFDIVVLTRNGVYVYDVYTHMYTSPGPCMPVKAFEDVFNAYSDLPRITEIEAIHSSNTDRVELYANNYVWSFLFAGLQQFTDYGYPMTYTEHLQKKTTMASLNYWISHPLWGIQRAAYGTQEMYFYENGVIHYYANSPPFYLQMTVTQKYYNVHSVGINPWTKLPSNIADILLIPFQWYNYIVLTSDGKCYEYIMNYAVNIKDPEVSLNLMGNILF
ncbi:unnamed protein product [Mytilus coruscus]|uniref:Uncharacterized protein n=1 Tax=Mytilus coruscus TaxID=42192 RepID=A0A6J8EES6_MYTCO|nr:unnamed protein product [Mytilus coruscus]